MTMRSDDQFVQAHLGGEIAAFEQLHDRYAGRVLGVLRGLEAHADRAEERAQRTWFRAIDRLAQFRGGRRFRAWLFTIAHRHWVDELASTRRRHAPSPARDAPLGIAHTECCEPTPPPPLR